MAASTSWPNRVPLVDPRPNAGPSRTRPQAIQLETVTDLTSGDSFITIDLRQRVSLADYPELMDQPCSYEQLRDCLRGISQVNRLTRAYAPTFQWLNHLYTVMPRQERPLHIVDVGCGYGDMLRQIHEWARERGLPVVLTGIDLNPDAVLAARAATDPETVTFLEGNAFDFRPPQGIDIVISSLLTHHLEDREIVEFLRWMETVARLGWFVNDLHRQPVPYYFFKIASKFTTWHRFVKHDGAVSIARSFRREDWENLTRAAEIPAGEFLVEEFPPARLCVARLKSTALLRERRPLTA